MTLADPVRIDLHRRMVRIRLFEEATRLNRNHRVLDGVHAARFCQSAAAYLTSPE